MNPPWIEWDPSEIIDDVLSYLRNQEEHQGLSEKELLSIAQSGPLEAAHEMALSTFLYEMNNWMKTTASRNWVVVGTKLGWRKRTVTKEISATMASDLLQAILPDTEVALKVYRRPHGGIRIRCSHHDAPTGEFYEVIPA